MYWPLDMLLLHAFWCLSFHSNVRTLWVALMCVFVCLTLSHSMCPLCVCSRHGNMAGIKLKSSNFIWSTTLISVFGANDSANNRVARYVLQLIRQFESESESDFQLAQNMLFTLLHNVFQITKLVNWVELYIKANGIYMGRGGSVN